MKIRNASPLVLAALLWAGGTLLANEQPTGEKTPAAAVNPADRTLPLAPASAKLVVSLDVRALDANPAFEPLWAKLMSLPNVTEKLEQFEQLFSFRLRRDLDRIVFACIPGVEDSKLILLEGRFDTARIKETLLNWGAAPDFHWETAIFTLPDEKNPEKKNYLAILEPKLLAFGCHDGLLAAVEGWQANAKAPAEPQSAAGKLVRQLPAEAVIRVGLDDLAALPGGKDPIRPALRQLSGAVLLGPQLKLQLSAECKDLPAAQNIKQVAEGGAALARLVLAQRPELNKLFGAALQSVGFTQNGACVAGGHRRHIDAGEQGRPARRRRRKHGVLGRRCLCGERG